MSEYLPVITLEDMRSLDQDEVAEGHRDGFHGAPEPGNNRSRSYWHGWRNGAVDGGFRPADEAQRELARLVVAAYREASL